MKEVHHMTKVCRIALAAAAILTPLCSHPSHAQQVTRGPYLQQGTPTSIVVRWRTDVPTDSRVSYGLTPGNLTFVADDAVLTTEHVVTLTGLNPDTNYYYSIDASAATLAGDDFSHFFITSPLPGTSKPTRLWILGDSGTKDANARADDLFFQSDRRTGWNRSHD
jgi:hypothetical protein